MEALYGIVQGVRYFRGEYKEIRKEVQLMLDKRGIKIEFDHHEVAQSQHEIDLKYANAIEMADG